MTSAAFVATIPPMKKTARKKKAAQRGGRPPRTAAAAEHMLRVRCTSDEWSKLEVAAHQSGLSMSELVRKGLQKIGVL